MKQLALILPGNQTIVPPAEIGKIIPPAGTYGLGYLGIAIELLFILATISCLGFIIYGGIKIITSEGDPKGVAGARTMIIYAIIGLATVFFSYLIINVIGHFVGINLLNGPTLNPGSTCPHKPC